MTAAHPKPKLKNKKSAAHLPAVERALERAMQVKPPATDVEALTVAVEDAVRSRELRELVELQARRSIFALHDQGMPQRDIAEAVGISQPEVSRRLKRRTLAGVDTTPREIILRRFVKALSTQQMMKELRTIKWESTAPGKVSANDGAATSLGNVKQLTTAFQDGLLSTSEYEKLRSWVTLHHEKSSQ